MIGISIGVASLRGEVASFSPASLFAASEPGVWLDPSDLPTLFQDAAGTTPVTAAGQPVGRVMDKSGNGFHATQATAAARPTYQVDSGGRGYLSFDGVDDGLATSSFDWASDEVTIVAAMTSALTGSQNMVVQGGGNLSTVGFLLAKQSNNMMRARSSGTAVASVIDTITVSGSPEIFTEVAKITGPYVRLRRNATQIAESTAAQGSGVFSSWPLSIGNYLGGQFLNGRIYGLVAINRVLTTPQLGWVERWMALKSGVTLA